MVYCPYQACIPYHITGKSRLVFLHFCNNKPLNKICLTYWKDEIQIVCRKLGIYLEPLNHPLYSVSLPRS